MKICAQRVIVSLFALTVLLVALGARAVAQDDFTLRLPVVLRQPVDPAPAGLIIYTDTVNGQNDIYTIQPGGTDKSRLTNTPEYEEFPRWSPDRRSIAFVRYVGAGQSPHLMLANADGSGERVLVAPTDSTSHIGRATWSPDGRRLAFHQYTTQTNRTNLFVVDVSGGDPINLTADLPYDTTWPEWSPDGTQILFLAYGTEHDLRILNLTGGGVTPLINYISSETPNDWSPDGATILFQAQYGSYDGLHTIPATGGASDYIIPDGQFGRWSADGASLVFTTENGGIFRAAADGSSVTPVDPSPDAWGPDW